jgi:membrane protein DedA with SNARE-associated domain
MHRHWRYPNITLLVISLIFAAVLLRYNWLEPLMGPLGSISYIGVFIVGFFFVSTFTVAPAAAILFAFSQDLHPFLVAIVGGAGAMLGDWLAYLFIKDRLLAELNPLFKALHIYRRVNLLHSKYFAWLAPVAGAIVIASPLPDELGLSLLGLTKMSRTRFLLLAFCSNAAGIFLISIAAQAR